MLKYRSIFLLFLCCLRWIPTAKAQAYINVPAGATSVYVSYADIYAAAGQAFDPFNFYLGLFTVIYGNQNVTGTWDTNGATLYLPGSYDATQALAYVNVSTLIGYFPNSEGSEDPVYDNVGAYVYANPPPPQPPTPPPYIISINVPSTVTPGQTFTPTVTAGTGGTVLSSIHLWMNGSPSAYGDYGNAQAFVPASGSNYTGSGNQVTAGPPGTVYTFYAMAQDVLSQTSGLPAYGPVTVTVVAPPDNPPTIYWTSLPGSVASGQTYVVSAHGHDVDGDLTQVNIWRNGNPYAFAGGGNGFDGDSGNPSTDTGPQTITYTAQAVDSHGKTSDLISGTVTIQPNPAPTVSINASPTSGIAPLTTTITWGSTNATSVTVSGPGLASNAGSGAQAVSLGVGAYTYTITASGPGGSASTQVSVNVVAATANLTLTGNPNFGTAFRDRLAGTPTTASQVFTLSNSGNSPLTVTSIVVAGATFSLSSASATPFVLGSGASASVTVTFTPGTHLGANTGTLTVTTSANNAAATLSGTGVAPQIGIQWH